MKTFIRYTLRYVLLPLLLLFNLAMTTAADFPSKPVRIIVPFPPDGHLLGIVTGSQVTNPLLGTKLSYDTLKDLTGVVILTRFHMGIYAHPSLPANKPSDLTPNISIFTKVAPGYNFSGVLGLVARNTTPPIIIKKIHDDFAAVMQTSEVLERIKSIGQELIASTPEEYNAYILDEIKK